jgi:cyanophycinase-like exopeptidase
MFFLMRHLLISTTAGLVLLAACQSESPAASPASVGQRTDATGSLGLVGDAADVSRTTAGGTMLMGGGTDVDAAFQWMISKSGGGDFLILRATGSDAYNAYVYGLGGVNSCETLLINSRTLANDPQVEAKIRGAEAVFIAGGNQANYVNFWKDTKVEDALNYVRNTKLCPIGGTSAGNAIAGSYYYSALNETITSSAALANPYDSNVTIGANDFLNLPYLANTITDTHFNNPDRRGRLVAFLARMSKDAGVRAARHRRRRTYGRVHRRQRPGQGVWHGHGLFPPAKRQQQLPRAVRVGQPARLVPQPAGRHGIQGPGHRHRHQHVQPQHLDRYRRQLAVLLR